MENANLCFSTYEKPWRTASHKCTHFNIINIIWLPLYHPHSPCFYLSVAEGEGESLSQHQSGKTAWNDGGGAWAQGGTPHFPLPSSALGIGGQGHGPGLRHSPGVRSKRRQRVLWSMDLSPAESAWAGLHLFTAHNPQWQGPPMEQSNGQEWLEGGWNDPIQWKPMSKFQRVVNTDPQEPMLLESGSSLLINPLPRLRELITSTTQGSVLILAALSTEAASSGMANEHMDSGWFISKWLVSTKYTPTSEDLVLKKERERKDGKCSHLYNYMYSIVIFWVYWFSIDIAWFLSTLTLFLWGQNFGDEPRGTHSPPLLRVGTSLACALLVWHFENGALQCVPHQCPVIWSGARI